MAKWDSCGSSPAFKQPHWMVRLQQIQREIERLMTQIGCEKRVKRKLVFYEQMYLLSLPHLSASNREEKTFVTC